MLPFLAPILGFLGSKAGIAALGAAGGIGASIYSTNKTNEANRRLAEHSRLHNERLLHLQNQYNEPLAQVSRLKQAGLSPMLAYGSGSMSNLSGTPIGEQTPRAHRFDPSLALMALQTISDYRLKRNTEKLQDSQSSLAKSQSIAALAKAQLDSARNLTARHDYDIYRRSKTASTDGSFFRLGGRLIDAFSKLNDGKVNTKKKNIFRMIKDIL